MFPIYNENTYIRIQYCTLKYRVKLKTVRLLAIQDSLCCPFRNRNLRITRSFGLQRATTMTSNDNIFKSKCVTANDKYLDRVKVGEG